MTVTGSIGLQVAPGKYVGASYELPTAPAGRTVLRFDQGEGYSVVHAASPEQTADWLERMAFEIRQATNKTQIHHITKAA
jgi:hypothetical protein